MRPRLLLVLVSALFLALAGLSPSPASGSAEVLLSLADQWSEMTDEERAVAWSMASLEAPPDDPAITEVAPDAGPFDSAGPAIVSMSRVFVPGQADVSTWNGIIPGGVWLPPTTEEFYAVGSGIVVNQLVFDDAFDECGAGQVEVAMFEEIVGTPRFPGLPGFITPDTTSTRAGAHLCRGGQNQFLYFTAEQPGQPFGAAHAGLVFRGPVPGIPGNPPQLIVLTENPDSILLPTVTVADDVNVPTTYRWRQWTAPATQTVDLSVPPEVTPEQEAAILTTLGRPLPAATDTDSDTDPDPASDADTAADTAAETETDTEAGDGDETSGDGDGNGDVVAADPIDDPVEEDVDDTAAATDGGNGLLLGLALAALVLALLVAFVFRNLLFGWLRSSPAPAPTPHTDEPVATEPDPQLDKFLNFVVNQNLDAGRRPDGDRLLEIDESQLEQAYDELGFARELMEARYGVFLHQASNKRLVVNVDTFEAVVRTDGPSTVGAD